MSLADKVQRYIMYVVDMKKLFTADVLLSKSARLSSKRNSHYKPHQRQKLTTDSAELDTSELVELLQRSAVEHLTIFRAIEKQDFHLVGQVPLITTDFEAMYAYKRGEYQQCLQLSAQNVHVLLFFVRMQDALDMIRLFTFPEFIQLFYDDIVSLVALTLIVHHVRSKSAWPIKPITTTINQLNLSLYLMTQCQLKLRHSKASLAQALDYIEETQRRYPVD